jgi:hypothetical protein
MKILDSILNSLPIPKKNEPVEYYFGLNISSNMVYGCVWGIRSGKLHVISSSKTVFESEKDLIEASNYVLDEALADFKPEPTKILFGVPDDWLADDDLKPEYLKTLKQLVKELDVVPLAYVASTNAISHLIARQTGVPLTAVLVHISDPVTVSVVKGGKVQGTKQAKKSDKLAKDIEKALKVLTENQVSFARHSFQIQIGDLSRQLLQNLEREGSGGLSASQEVFRQREGLGEFLAVAWVVDGATTSWLATRPEMATRISFDFFEKRKSVLPVYRRNHSK